MARKRRAGSQEDLLAQLMGLIGGSSGGGTGYDPFEWMDRDQALWQMQRAMDRERLEPAPGTAYELVQGKGSHSLPTDYTYSGENGPLEVPRAFDRAPADAEMQDAYEDAKKKLVYEEMLRSFMGVPSGTTGGGSAPAQARAARGTTGSSAVPAGAQQQGAATPGSSQALMRNPQLLAVLRKAAGDPETQARAIKDRLQELDKQLSITNLSLSDDERKALSQERDDLNKNAADVVKQALSYDPAKGMLAAAHELGIDSASSAPQSTGSITFGDRTASVVPGRTGPQITEDMILNSYGPKAAADFHATGKTPPGFYAGTQGAASARFPGLSATIPAGMDMTMPGTMAMLESGGQQQPWGTRSATERNIFSPGFDKTFYDVGQPATPDQGVPASIAAPSGDIPWGIKAAEGQTPIPGDMSTRLAVWNKEKDDEQNDRIVNGLMSQGPVVMVTPQDEEMPATGVPADQKEKMSRLLALLMRFFMHGVPVPGQ